MVRKTRKRSRLQCVVNTKPDDVPSSPPWIDLPSDITANILGRLDTTDRIHRAYNVCTTWRIVCRDYPHMWRVIHLSQSASGLEPRQLVNMCHKAVDCSQGQLVDITMDGFYTNALLRYIAKRCSQLQRLRIVFTSKVSRKVLIKALEKFPMLNELYLFSLWSSTTQCSNEYYFDVKSIGRSCPMLNSFTYSYRVDVNTMDRDDNDALEVAEFMPGLRHLALLGNTITDEGVVAILDGCPQLESLDIRLCLNIAYNDLSEDTIERCRRQLKQVWLPEDSCSDHEFYDRFGHFVSWVEEIRENGNYSPGYGWYAYY